MQNKKESLREYILNSGGDIRELTHFYEPKNPEKLSDLVCNLPIKASKEINFMSYYSPIYKRIQFQDPRTQLEVPVDKIDKKKLEEALEISKDLLNVIDTYQLPSEITSKKLELEDAKDTLKSSLYNIEALEAVNLNGNSNRNPNNINNAPLIDPNGMAGKFVTAIFDWTAKPIINSTQKAVDKIAQSLNNDNGQSR